MLFCLILYSYGSGISVFVTVQLVFVFVVSKPLMNYTN